MTHKHNCLYKAINCNHRFMTCRECLRFTRDYTSPCINASSNIHNIWVGLCMLLSRLFHVVALPIYGSCIFSAMGQIPTILIVLFALMMKYFVYCSHLMSFGWPHYVCCIDYFKHLLSLQVFFLKLVLCDHSF